MRKKHIFLAFVIMLLWTSNVCSQNNMAIPDISAIPISSWQGMMNLLGDEQKAFIRDNLLVAPSVYDNNNNHPGSFVITPNPAPDTQSGVECAACSSAYLLRFYGAEANGVEMYHNPTFPCKHKGGAFPRCFRILFEQQLDGYTAEYYTGTTEDLRDAVSKGVPVIVLLLYNGNSLHYVPVVGYDDTYFYIQDSVDKYRNVTDNDDYNEKLDIATFDAMWNIPFDPCRRLFVLVHKK